MCDLTALLILLSLDLLLLGLSDLCNTAGFLNVFGQILLSQIFVIGNLQNP